MIDPAVSDFLTLQIAEGERAIAHLRSAMPHANNTSDQTEIIQNLLYANHRLQHVLHVTMANLTRVATPIHSTAALTIQPSR